MNDRLRQFWKTRRRVLLPVVAGVIVLVPAIIVGVWWLQRSRLKTVAPRRGPIIEAVYGIGTITARREFRLRIGVASTIVSFSVTEGQRVTAGQPMVQLAEIPVFRAPYAGTITAVPFSAGETVFPQVPILTLTDTADPYLEVVLEQEGALRVRADQLARFNFETLRGLRFEGRVRSVYPNDGQFRVHIDAENLPPEILPGMTADVAIEVSRKDEALLIPVTAVHAGRVTVLRDGRRKKIELELGSVDGEWAEVVSGDIQAGDELIVP